MDQILNTGVANTLAGNDRLTGTGNDYGFKNVGTLNTDDGNDTITGTATSSGNGITISFGSTLDTGNGDDRIIGSAYLNNGLVNGGIVNTSDGSDHIYSFGRINGFINEGMGIFNTSDGNDYIYGDAGENGFINRGVFNTDDGNDTISGFSSGSGIITDSGSILDTGNGEDFISFTGSFVNRGGVFLGEGNDSIINLRSFAPNFENFNFIGTGDGDDRIWANVIYNEGVINTGNGNDSIIVNKAIHTGGGSIYNNGGSINTGDGNDSIIADEGFESDPNSSGAWFLGEGEDYIKGFGNGDFYGGNGNDTLELTPGTYTVGIWGEGGESPIFTKGNQLMITSEFEKLKAGNTLYDFTSLTAGQIITVA
jgi:hypothetical protein